MEYRTIEYKNYIVDHINEVKRQYEKYKELFMELFPEVYLIESHDQSKFSKAEFIPYLNRFYPAPGQEKNSDYEFNIGWLHHIHNNPHHPQYWVLNEDGKEYIYDMPNEYLIEMICDWLAMGVKKKDNIWDYWNTKGKDKKYSAKTRLKIEYIISKIKTFDDRNHF